MNSQEPAAPVLGGGGFLRIRLDLAYDGGPFSGWAVQPGRRTVQGVLEEALALLIRRPDPGHRGRTHRRRRARPRPGGPPGPRRRPSGTGCAAGHDLEPAVALLRRLRGALSRVLGDLSRCRGGAPGRRWPRRASTPGSPPSGAATATGSPTAPLQWDPLLRAHHALAQGTPGRRPAERGRRAAAGAAGLPVLLQAPGGRHHHPRTAALRLRPRSRRRHCGHRAGGRVLPQHGPCPAWARRCAWARARGAGLAARAAAGAANGTPSPCWPPPHPLVLEEVAYPDDDGLLARAELTRAVRLPPALTDDAGAGGGAFGRF